ncbi:MAG TPA: hybrid sensor histidine kinase/response regulator [Verrucomicrobiae bacterium]|jgi:signal transduction histidine kinase|nr:hybrid sensor histidine kinase/response regulator [Verrucomicrobiae bacterium]
MSSRRRPHLKFQAKVLFPVVAALALFVVAAMWLVRSRLQTQSQDAALRTLATTEAGFTNNLMLRVTSLMDRFSAVAVDQNAFLPLALKIANPEGLNTMRGALHEILERRSQDASIALFSGPDGKVVTNAVQHVNINRERFAAACQPAIEEVLDNGEPTVHFVECQNEIFTVICAPSIKPGNVLLGVLTVGIQLDTATAHRLKPLNSELVFIAHDQIAASTLEKVDLNGELLQRYHELAGRSARPRAATIELQEEPFVPKAGRLPFFIGENDSGYLLLFSYAAVQRQIQDTQRILALGGIIGIVLGAAVVYLLVRQVTKPLRDLRDSAEAVGRGDFSKRIEIRSHDELGELAAVFNHMTDNLQKSTAQLEKTVAQLRDTQAKLLHSEKLSAVGEFVAGVAHELNNPLTALIGFAELLQMGDVDDDSRESLNRITVAAGRCHKIVQSLLSFSRQRPPERKLTDLNHVLDAVIEILIYELRTNNIKIIKGYSAQLPKLLVDPHQMQQVFLNIVNNARQAIEAYRPHGSIRIVTRPLADRVQIRFEDDGPGMAEETAAKIFDPFFTTKPVGKGTGLGLSLSYGIVQEHGGSINVESKLNHGTTFIIDLPITAGSESASDLAASAAAQAAAPALQGRGKMILVVDDEEDIVELVRKTLERRGYTVRTAQNGESALRHLAHDTFDLIISDWKMPGLNGQQLYERLLQIQPKSAERMIFMTGDVLSERTEKYLQEHEKICLTKPFSLTDFERAVRDTFAAA